MIGCSPSLFDAVFLSFIFKLAETLWSLWHFNHTGQKQNKTRKSWALEWERHIQQLQGHSLSMRNTAQQQELFVFLLRKVANYTYECSDVWSSGCAALVSPGPVILVTCEHQAAVDNNVPFICLLHNATADHEWLGGCIIAKIYKLNRSYRLGD